MKCKNANKANAPGRLNTARLSLRSSHTALNVGDLRRSMKKYDREYIEYLYKYSPIEIAIKILENGTSQYSSPSTFNDRFDIHTDLLLSNYLILFLVE